MKNRHIPLGDLRAVMNEARRLMGMTDDFKPYWSAAKLRPHAAFNCYLAIINSYRGNHA